MRPYHDIDIDDDGNGGAWVSHDTNDNRDGGAPEDASWRDHWPNVDRALKALGVSRIGCSGITVTVRHNGVRI